MIQFRHENTTYVVEFTREHKPIGMRDPVDPKTIHKIYSHKPYTTVRILEAENGKPRNTWKVYRTATVGCWWRDQHSKDKGRIHALRSVMLTLPREMYRPLWTAYQRSRKVQSVASRRTHLLSQIRLLGTELTALAAENAK